MKIALIQSNLVWEDPVQNRTNFELKISEIKAEVDLIVLPEMFATGFTMRAAEAFETMQGETLQWLQKMAKQKNCAITGSLIIKENESFYNRLLFVFPTAEIEYYDKRHLFSLAGEHKVFTAGTEKKIIEYLGWKICLQICYDLRFPVFSRNTENYDLLLYVANWPTVRTIAWDSLLRARAIENLSYVVAVNRVGLDGHNNEHIGHSQVIDFLGNYILPPQEIEAVFILDLDKNSLLETREKLNFLNDKDQYEISY